MKPYVELYGIWSEERGWWYTGWYALFWTEHYEVACVQETILQRSPDTNRVHHDGEWHPVNWQVQALSGRENDE